VFVDVVIGGLLRKGGWWEGEGRDRPPLLKYFSKLELAARVLVGRRRFLRADTLWLGGRNPDPVQIANYT
jgi:hypothetical protein